MMTREISHFFNIFKKYIKQVPGMILLCSLLLNLSAADHLIAGHDTLEGWDDTYEDGTLTGATIFFEDRKGIIQGTSDQQNYGFVSRDVDVDLDKFPILEISVKEVTEGWYLVIFNKDLSDGYRKLENNNGHTGIFEYNLKEMLGLQGRQRCRIALGVVVERSGVSRNINQYMKFDHIRFKSRNGLVRKDIDSVSLKNRRVEALPLPVSRTGFPFTRKSLEGSDGKSREPFEALAGVRELFGQWEKKSGQKTAPGSLFRIFPGKEELLFRNEEMDVILNSRNGSFLRVMERKSGKRLLFSGREASLWRMDLDDGTSVSSLDMTFSHAEEKGSLILKYSDEETGSSVEIQVTPSLENTIDFQAHIRNNFNRNILNFTFPDTLLFDFRNMDYFLFPFKLGLALNKKFYSQKRQLSEKYPNLFCDLASLRLKEGRVSLYGLQDGKELFRPAVWETGYHNEKAGAGYFTHKFAVYVRQKGLARLPVLRMNFTPDIKGVIEDYGRENNISQSPGLEQKLGTSLFERLKRSVLLKMEVSNNKDFGTIRSFLPELSAPTLVHLVTYWKGGFDRNYPDYLPPDEVYGTLDEFKDLCQAIRASGHILMPYTNPTWWNESATLSSLGKERTVLRDLTGKLITEEYNRSIGYVMDNYNTNVIKRIDRTVEEFSAQVPVDILFEDQLGARTWLYAINPDMPDPVAYSQGLVDIARRNSKRIPLFTEEGFDRLIPYESGFCNMSAAGGLPPDDIYNTRFGTGTWSIFPLALFLAHEKTAFYQHNLAHEVFADAKEKISWNLLFGHNMNCGRWISAWRKQEGPYRMADVVQKEIASRCFGKKLTDHREISRKVYMSQFEDIIILANFSDEDYIVAGYAIAPNGFMAFDRQGTLLAGVFTRFEGTRLAGERVIVMNKKGAEIHVRQLSAENCFLRIRRPSSWVLNSSISALYGDQEVPLFFDKDHLGLYLEYGMDERDYTLSYRPNLQTGMDIQPSLQANEKDYLVNMELSLFQPLEKARIRLELFKVSPLGSYPAAEAGPGYRIISDTLPLLEGNNKYVFRIPVQVRGKQEKDDLLFTRISILEKDKLLKQVMGWDSLSEKVDIILESKNMLIRQGEEKKAALTVYNHSGNDFQGKVQCSYPEGVKGPASLAFLVKKQSFWKTNAPFQCTGKFTDKAPSVVYSLSQNKKDKTMVVLKLGSEETGCQIDLDPVNLLLLNRTNRLKLRIRDLPEEFQKARLYVDAPGAWWINGPVQGQAIDLSESNFIEYDIFLVPGKAGEGELTIRLKGKMQELKVKEKFKCMANNEPGILLADVNHDGIEDVILGNSRVELLMTPILGGRLLKMINRLTGNNQLFCDYPGVERTTGSEWKHWTEYGGLNDWWPSGWPGDVWNNTWEYRIREKSPDLVRVSFSSSSVDGKLSIRKEVSLKKEKCYVQFDYQFTNLTKSPVTFFYNTHPDLAPGPDESADPYDAVLVSVKKGGGAGIKEIPFIKSMQKTSFIPVENWCVAIDQRNNEYLGQVFEKDKVKEIGVWQGPNFFSMELLSPDLILDAGQETRLRFCLFTGRADWKDNVQTIQKEVMQK
ncbi:MAG: DUF6259 domain-containing protein [bacterium]|nr:DUF6259 domain-containing protein [bacterium]